MAYSKEEFIDFNDLNLDNLLEEYTSSDTDLSEDEDVESGINKMWKKKISGRA